MSEQAKQKKIRLTYKNIKHALFASLTPSWVVLRDSLAQDHFEEAMERFENLMRATSEWLRVVKDHTKQNGGLIDIDTVNKVIKHPDYLKMEIPKPVEACEVEKEEEKEVNKGSF